MASRGRNSESQPGATLQTDGSKADGAGGKDVVFEAVAYRHYFRRVERAFGCHDVAKAIEGEAEYGGVRFADAYRRGVDKERETVADAEIADHSIEVAIEIGDESQG